MQCPGEWSLMENRSFTEGELGEYIGGMTLGECACTHTVKSSVPIGDIKSGVHVFQQVNT